jgi:UDPglucose 6-dehydrogenase
MGLAFKPNTDDIRDAKALVIVEEIVKAGGSVSAYDPIATDNFRRFFPDIDYKDSVYEVSEDADALVLVTEWNEFRQLDLNRLGSKMKTRVLFDGRRVYKKETAERAGFDYYTIGSN